MSDGSGLSDAKRALLEGYLRGVRDPSKTTKETSAAPRPFSPPRRRAIRRQVPSPSRSDPGAGRQGPFLLSTCALAGRRNRTASPWRTNSDRTSRFTSWSPIALTSARRYLRLRTSLPSASNPCALFSHDGPYRLGGYCGAGFIVRNGPATTCRRAASREADTGRAWRWSLLCSSPRLDWRASPQVGTLLRLTPDRQLSWFLRMRHIYKSARYHAYRGAFRFSLVPKQELLRGDWLAIFVWIVSGYVPRPYAGKVTYVWARDESGSHRSWWLRTFLAQETEVYYTAGDRSNCRSIHVHDLAAQLRACLS